MKEEGQPSTLEVSCTDNIDDADLLFLQQIARNQVIEPFTGRRSLETIQKTRTEMEKGLGKIKDASSKAGKWISKSRIAGQSQKKISSFIQELKEKPSSERFAVFFEKMNQTAEEIQKIAKQGYAGIEEKTKRLTLSFIEKGLEMMLYEDTSRWILKRANRCLDRTDLVNSDQIQQLSRLERQQLIEELYPYDSRLFKKYMKGFDTSVNIGLGAVVATNIPGTGLAVSLVNMGKTLIKIGNRLNIMSAIYGRQISSKEALFKISANIIRSLEDWESNDQHTPLDPDILSDLYNIADEEDEDAIKDLLDTVFRKDAYIAIPGVGMVSLGKINLDDMKMDLVVLHLVQNYEEKARMIRSYGKECVEQVLSDFSEIYRSFFESDYFKEIRKKIVIHQGVNEKAGWKSRLKMLAGEDNKQEEASNYLDLKVREIYGTTRFMNEPIRKEQIRKAVKAALDQYTGING